MAKEEKKSKKKNKADKVDKVEKAAKAAKAEDGDSEVLQEAIVMANAKQTDAAETVAEVVAEITVEHAHACCHKTKDRSDKEKKDLMNRLSRVEGQIRGIKRLVEEDTYCTDILIQVAAANAALNSFNKALLSNHIRGCVAEDIRQGKEETVDELVAVLQKLMK